MDSREEQRREAEELRDTIRGGLGLFGGRPDDVKLTETAEGRPEITIKLNLTRARYVAEQLDAGCLRAQPIPSMVLWNDQLCRLGRVESRVGEWVKLFPLYRGSPWRSPLGALRPPLLGEIEAAQKVYHGA